jgi:hypothetical protein
MGSAVFPRTLLRAGRPLRAAALAACCACAALTALGCDDGPMRAQEDEFTGRRGTPEELLTSWFEAVYSRKDATRYAEMLAPEFRFDFVRADAESVWTNCEVLLPGTTSWARSTEVACAQQIFGDGDVGAIALDIEYDPSLDVGDSTQDCPDCRKVTTTITLQVATGASLPEPLILAVAGKQEFIVARDRTDMSLWVVRRQTDFEPEERRAHATPPAGGHVGLEATYEVTWGRVKSLYCPPPATARLR